MKKVLNLFSILLLFSAVSFGQTHYQWHASFFSDWYGTGVTTNSETLGGVEYEYVTSTAASANTDFVIEWDNGYNRWKATSVPFNSVFTFTWYPNANNNPPGDSQLGTSTTSGYYYTLRIKGRSYSDRDAIIMETSGLPVTVTNVSDDYTSAGSNVNVSITTSGTPPSEQLIFVRYTTDGWSTSSFVEATGSGTAWSATIPSGDVTGTSNNSYYVMTTTVSSPSHTNADLETINLDNNSGSNYALPVELTSFTGTLVNNAVELNWETATEVNNAGFNVECRIENGEPVLSGTEEWTTKDFVPGNGTTNSPKSYSYTDTELPDVNEVSYRLKQIDNDGTFSYSKVVTVNISNVTGIEDGSKQYKFKLSQNYPNPFNPTTQISFTVPETAEANLKIYDVLGNEIAEIFNDKAEAGQVYNLNFDASNFSSGVYFYKLTSQNNIQLRKMLLVK